MFAILTNNNTNIPTFLAEIEAGEEVLLKLNLYLMKFSVLILIPPRCRQKERAFEKTKACLILL